MSDAPRPVGRPTDYRPEYCEQAAKLCALGATDDQIADFLGVAMSTFYLWKHAHPEFSESIKTAKEIADDRVERSLYHRAVGYQTDAVKIFQYEGSELVVPYRENVQPDTTAAIFWLKNRKPEQWRDVSRQERTGPDGGPQQLNVTGDAVADLTRRLARLAPAGSTTGSVEGSE